MSQVKLEMKLPLDDEGFLRRECPHCEQEFKWFHTEPNHVSSGALTPPAMYFCPLCGESAGAGAWWTTAQAEYAAELAKEPVLSPMLNDFQARLQRLNRPGGGFRVMTTPVHFDQPAPLPPEPNDMRVVTPPCHPDEPIKVPKDWIGPVHCRICGQTIFASKGE